ncbi:amino acid ABC transporter substrate-binding protein, PAAT family [Methanococcus maripaludis C5]|uniref:Amino acid ABC transporter substrate-binding protein, PAAT family n=1 Tax=Methanococcus maripaludis (strain C5 / ATCC BAA-1333) TaxID=402880 RepID=A4FXE9_METM5|nr:ABC transporter substrate-binding protein [Methanococcus maripaludis]ABO34878.1 amino acid ABC transporter substrate-binding protein, PAAT family [Methanococcus maripaludis C5]
MLKFKIPIILTAFLVLISGCLSNSESLEKETLVVGITPEIYPINYMNSGVHSGFEIEYITEIVNRMNMKPEFRVYEFMNLLNAVETDRVDCAISLITITPEREELVMFSKSYLNTTSVHVVDKNTGIETLDKCTVGVIKSTVQDECATKLKENYEFTLYKYRTTAELERAFDQGKVNAMIVDKLYFEYVLYPKNNNLTSIFECQNSENISIAVNNENTELLNDINNVITEMEEDGTYDNLKNK